MSFFSLHTDSLTVTSYCSTSNDSESRVLAGALGGVIGGAMLIVILLLTTSCTSYCTVLEQKIKDEESGP